MAPSGSGARAARQGDRQVAHVVHRVPVWLGDAQGHVENAVALVESTDRTAAQRRLYRRIRVGDIDSVARHAPAVERDVEFGLPAHLDRRNVRCAANAVDDAGHLAGLVFQDFQVRPENLDRDFALHAGQRLFHVVLDHLREIGRHPGYFVYLLRHVGDHLFLVGKAPGVARLEVGHDFHVVGSLGVGAVIGTAHLGHDVVHFGVGAQYLAHPAFHPLGRIQRGRRRQGDGQPDVALVQLGQELGAQKHGASQRQQPAGRRKPSRCAGACVSAHNSRWRYLSCKLCIQPLCFSARSFFFTA